MSAMAAPATAGVTDDVDDFDALFAAHYARLVRTLTLVAGDQEVAADADQTHSKISHRALEQLQQVTAEIACGDIAQEDRIAARLRERARADPSGQPGVADWLNAKQQDPVVAFARAFDSRRALP